MAAQEARTYSRKRGADRALGVLTRGERNAVKQLVTVAVQHPHQAVLAGERDQCALLAADGGRKNRRGMGHIVVAHIVWDGW